MSGEKKLNVAQRKNSISFCIPTHNRPTLLAEAVKSILMQEGLGNVDYEVLVSDDSPGEETARWVAEKMEKNRKIKYFKNPQKGQFNNLNNLITKAEHEWIVFLHDDDLLVESYLSTVLKTEILDDDEIEVVWTARKLIGRNGEEIAQTKSKNARQKVEVVDCNEFFNGMLLNNDYCFGGNTIPPLVTGIAVKKELVLRAGFFEQKFEMNADSLFLWKLFFMGQKAAYINELLIEYRVVDDSERGKPATKGIVYSEMKGILFALLDFLKERLPNEKYLNVNKKALDNFYANSMVVNGPILWIALRYSGSFCNRVKIQMRIFTEAIKNVPRFVLKPQSWIVIFVSFLPQCVLRCLFRLWLRTI